MNKNLISQLVVSICAILLIATVTFAWFAISNTADAGFVAQVGDLESTFEFAAVENDKLVDSSGVSTLDMKDVIPGQKFYFFMKVETKGSEDGKVSIMLNDIKSYYATPGEKEHEYKLVDNYSNTAYEKIQYAFCYSIKGAYWVPVNTVLDNKKLSQSDPLSVVVKKEYDANNVLTNNNYWIEFSDVEKKEYYFSEYELGENSVRFNEVENGTDQDDYVLMKNVDLKGDSNENIEKTAEDHNAFVVIFEIDFKETPELPSFVKIPDNFDETYSNMYADQLFSITNISIITSKENE